MMKCTELQRSAADRLAQNNYSEAIALYEQCIETDSTVLSSYWYLGLALLLDGKELEAQSVWLSVMVQGNSEQTEIWVTELINILETEALRQQKIGNFSQAEQIYWQILQQNQNHTKTYETLAEVLIAQSKIDEAVALYQRTVELKFEFSEVDSKLQSLIKEAQENLDKKQSLFPPVYKPDVFYVDSLESAKSIILTPTHSTSTEERWIKETPYLLKQLGKELQANSGDLILDYGCGVGRLAKEIIARYGCVVLGVDISNQMLELAINYVGSQRFITCSPAALDQMVSNGLRVDHAYSIWVIQHCFDPHSEINRIKQALKSGGRFYIVNSNHRCVPSDKGWVNDGIDIVELLRRGFQEVNYSTLPDAVTTSEIAHLCFSMTLQKLD